jgi:hypothetical protein
VKICGGVGVYIHVLLSSALGGSEWSASRLTLFTPWKRTPDIQWIGARVGFRAYLDDMEKLTFLILPELRLPAFISQASSQSLYRKRYRGPHILTNIAAFKMNPNSYHLHALESVCGRSKRNHIKQFPLHQVSCSGGGGAVCSNAAMRFVWQFVLRAPLSHGVSQFHE